MLGQHKDRQILPNFADREAVLQKALELYLENVHSACVHGELGVL
jgi:hypothetical protein